MKNVVVMCFVFFVVCVAMGQMASAEQFPEIMFILDGSGSMQGDAGGITKLAAAKSVLNTVIPGLPAEVNAGLAAYGHRREKDCSDVEVLIAPGSSDRSQVLSQIAGIQAVGMTPISAAVTQVADMLKGRDAETTIVLVSDGKETCGGDPCAVVKALKAAGIKFVMHVVGFDVSNEERTQLTCIAEAGGGKYFGASDASSLLAALQEVSEELTEKVEKAKAKTVRKSTGLGKLNLVFPESGLKSLSGLKIVRKKDAKTVKEGDVGSADSIHPLMSGDYELLLLFANPNYKDPDVVPITDFAISGGEVTDVNLGVIVYNIAEELDDLPLESVNIVDAETGEVMLKSQHHGNGYYMLKPKPMPAGIYDIAFQYSQSPSPLVVAKGVDVASGRESYVTLDSGIILDSPEAGGVTGWDLVPSGQEKPVLEVRRRWDNDYPLWRKFAVPSGSYDVMIHMDGMDEPLMAGEGVEIGSGELLTFSTGL